MKRTMRGLQGGELFERRVALAPEPQDFPVEQLLTREMPEQEGLGYAGGLGELARRRAGKPVAREKRHRRRDDRLAALVAIQPG
jgi:hypothetical protein